jgi:hypothetical protein
MGNQVPYILTAHFMWDEDPGVGNRNQMEINQLPKYAPTQFVRNSYRPACVTQCAVRVCDVTIGQRTQQTQINRVESEMRPFGVS